MKRHVIRMYKKICSVLSIDPISGNRIDKISNLVKVGTNYGGWTIPTDLLASDSICYTFGAGEDISFDIELLSTFQCQVFCYDPTPRALEYVKSITSDFAPPHFHFFPQGIWYEDSIVKFYSPQNPDHVSHSITNFQKTQKFIEVECKTLKTILNQNNHEMIDLMKMDIEGAEYQVIDNICKEDINIGILCVEFHYQKNEIKKLRSTIKRLIRNGFHLSFVENDINFTFINPNYFRNKKIMV